MKGCELCSYPARIYCEADGASLCSHCDEKVHSANFLVAKHSRSLLCHVCQSPTPWKASGTKLGPTVSVCESCVVNCNGKQGRGPEMDEEGRGGNENNETEDDFEGEDYTDDDEDEDGDYGDDEDEEDGDIQVVPWSSTPPPPVASSSSSEEVSSWRISSAGGEGVSALKRTRENADLDSDDEIGCTSSRFNNIPMTVTSSQASENDEATFSVSRRSAKLRRPNEGFQSERVQDRNEAESRSVAMILSSLRELQQNTMSDDDDASAVVLGISRLSRDPTAI